MRSIIKEWEQDGYDLTAYHIPDESGLTPEDREEGPMAGDSPEWVETWHSRLAQFRGGAWYYVGVIVEARKFGVELGSASLRGIESDSSEYYEQVAGELAEEAIGDADTTLEKLVESYGEVTA